MVMTDVKLAKKWGGVSYADQLVLRNVWVLRRLITIIVGDALLYVILPVHADAFGVSLAIVGFAPLIVSFACLWHYCRDCHGSG